MSLSKFPSAYYHSVLMAILEYSLNRRKKCQTFGVIHGIPPGTFSYPEALLPCLFPFSILSVASVELLLSLSSQGSSRSSSLDVSKVLNSILSRSNFLLWSASIKSNPTPKSVEWMFSILSSYSMYFKSASSKSLSLSLPISAFLKGKSLECHRYHLLPWKASTQSLHFYHWVQVNKQRGSGGNQYFFS